MRSRAAWIVCACLAMDAGCTASVSTVCSPGAMRPCTSPLCSSCHVGTQACAADGSAWGECQVSCGPPCDAGPPAIDASACVGTGLVVPGADRACTTDSDCIVVEHQTDCCGTLEAHGIRHDRAAAFDVTENTCRAQFPACGCASGTETVDDGANAPAGSGLAAVRIACDAGVCTTHVRARATCGTMTCSETQVCVNDCWGHDAGIDAQIRCVDVVPACVGQTDCGCLGGNDPCTHSMCTSIHGATPTCLNCDAP